VLGRGSVFGFFGPPRLILFITFTRRKTISPVPNKPTKRAAPSEPEQDKLQDALKTRRNNPRATIIDKTIKAALSPGVASLYSRLMVLIFSLNLLFHFFISEVFFFGDGSMGALCNCGWVITVNALALAYVKPNGD
jgi:hypothetical protein